MWESYTLTLSINVTYVVIALLALAWPTFYLIRYYLLPSHSTRRASAGTQAKSGPDGKILQAQSSATTATAVNELPSSRRFLPEEIFANFLSSIKIFNYLDRAVLVEFARNSQQRKLYANEYLVSPATLKEDSQPEDLNLYLVMDGCVQVLMQPLK